ncbi:hypothetical protein [Roseateles sp.]|uniref:hypothetical protein n=1 Tax=Roseateles sp. TaxID=1971397 RepID=UPI003BAAFD48
MHRRQLALGLGSTLLAGLPLAAVARDDDGEFVIVQARYGVIGKQVDVTARLRELARRDQRVRLTNELFGVDPAPGRTKTLRIIARDRQGQDRTLEYRERDWIDGARFIGWRSGKWGDSGSWQPGGGRNDDFRDGGRDSGEFTILYATYGTQRREVDVTDRLRELARRDQRFRMGNETFGVDPDPGQTKRLRIVARDRNGRERSFEYAEYSTVDGAQFIGWGGGDWGGPRRPPAPPPGRLVIESASYGVDGAWSDVTQALRAQVRGDRFEAEVGNDLFGFDPAPGRRKLLSVTYRFDNQPSSTARVRESDTLRLP